MTAPTVDQLWNAFEERVLTLPGVGLRPDGELSDAVTAYMAAAEEVFTDLRPSEERELQILVHDALDPVREQFTAALMDAGAAALATFAERHPDAPRATLPSIAA